MCSSADNPRVLARSALAFVFLLAACATAEKPPQESDRIYHSGHGTWGDRQLIDFLVMPVVWIDPDIDTPVPGSTADEWTGPGYAIRGAVGNRDQSVGVLFQGAHVESDDSNVEIDCYAIYLDFDVSVALTDGPTGFLLHAGAGIGAAQLIVDDPNYDDVTTGAMNLRVDLEFAASPTFSFLAGLGGFAWGHPGETEALGTFIELGGRFLF